MSREAFDFLTESVFWSQKDQDDEFADLSDKELKEVLAEYRAHVLEQPSLPVGTNELGVAVSARQGEQPSDSMLKRSVLYFDEVLLPDPVFAVTEWTREHVLPAWMPKAMPRRELVRAARYMQGLTPLVSLGRVRFVPSTHELEGPEQVRLVVSEDAFASMVPEQLRDWFYKRADIRKVITNEQGERLVLSKSPDADTSSIHIYFGQLGTMSTYDHMHLVGVNEEDQTITTAQAPPEDEAAMRAWLFQSVNRASGDFLGSVLTDVRGAGRLGCSFLTSCTVTAELLDAIQMLRKQPDLTDLMGTSALRLELPIVEAASFNQLAELIERQREAFEAFRFELKVVIEELALIDEPSAWAEEARKAANKLTRNQVHEVERKMHETRRKLKWTVPCTVASLAAGAFNLVASGDPSIFSTLSTSFTGGVLTAVTMSEHRQPHNLPGYFLWRLATDT